MYSNLSLCSAMLFLSDHWMTFSRSRWSSLTSFSDLTAIEILVSSAKHLTMECIMQFSMSLMNIRKRMGPRTVPWGTPLMMAARRDKWPSTTTACFRFDRKDSIQLIASRMSMCARASLRFKESIRDWGQCDKFVASSSWVWIFLFLREEICTGALALFLGITLIGQHIKQIWRSVRVNNSRNSPSSHWSTSRSQSTAESFSLIEFKSALWKSRLRNDELKKSGGLEDTKEPF